MFFAPGPDENLEINVEQLINTPLKSGSLKIFIRI